MATARVIRSRGRHILPKGIRPAAAKLWVRLEGEEIVLGRKRSGLGRIYDLVRQMPADMLEAITDEDPRQEF